MNILAYAVDVVLFASSRQWQNHLLSKFVERAVALGLTLGIRKCVTSGLRWLEKQKKVVLDRTPFTVGQDLPVLAWGEVCKYL